MSENIPHYNLHLLCNDVLEQVKAHQLSGPTFIGQGITRSVGSDAYGSYIVAKKIVGRKTIWGIASADAAFHADWTEGTMDCSIDLAKVDEKQLSWIVASGKWKKTGALKWWYCDAQGKKYNGQKARFSWNGAYSYRDPSF